MPHETTDNMPFWRIWLLATRPKTLPAAVVPVAVGGVIAFDGGVFHLWSFLAALFGATAIQIGTNFANDLFDYKKKADTADRTGPLRVTQAGLATPHQTAMATAVAFSLAVLAGAYLVYRGGWPIVIIGLLSITCGVLYTAGPLALAYLGLADMFVLVFFGPVALAGTYYVQALDVSRVIILAGLPFGMISTAILTVNNLRDVESDRRSGKKTLVVRFGRPFARAEYLILLIGAAVSATIMAILMEKRLLFLTWLYLPAAWPTVKAVFTSDQGETLNRALATTGKLLLLYGLLFSIGWLW